MKKTIGPLALFSLSALPASAMAQQIITLPSTPSQAAPQSPISETLTQMRRVGDASGCTVGEDSYYAVIQDTFPVSCAETGYNAVYEGVGMDQTGIHAEFASTPNELGKQILNSSYMQIAMRNDAIAKPFAETIEVFGGKDGDKYVVTRALGLMASAPITHIQIEFFDAAGKILATQQCDVDAKTDKRTNCMDAKPVEKTSLIIAIIAFAQQTRVAGIAYFDKLADMGVIKPFDADASRAYLANQRQRYEVLSR